MTDGLDLISRGETSVVCALICNVLYDVSFSAVCVVYRNEQIGCIEMFDNRFSVK